MNAASASKDFGAGPQQQMIGIREENLRARVLERLRQLRLHGGLRAHRHEERRPHFVVQGVKRRGPRARAGRLRVETKV